MLSKEKLLLLLVLTCFACLGGCQYVSPPYPEWAHSHVVWYNRYQTEKDVVDMANGYMKHQIPFGGFNIDSGWSTCYNDFVWNETKFPDPQKLIDWFHSNQVRVMLWATSVVNTNCPNYQEAKQKGYFLNNAKTIHWWHGEGSFVDFFNPEAVKWWEGQMDKVLNMGIDGFKCDGTDPETLLLRPWPYSAHLKRYITRKQYSHKYYGVFFNHTQYRNSDGLIMARPVDSFHGKIYLEYAPKYVMFSGWVGDQNSDADGLKQAIGNVIHSAWKGYLNFGFDIGGYRGSNKEHILTKQIYLRWVQAGAFVPFMENGGQGKHAPWSWGEDAVKIYRKFVLVHMDLKDFFLDAGTQAYAKGVSVIQPLARKQGWINVSELDTFSYVLWNTFLISPIFSESGQAEVQFPKGKWIYYFNYRKTFEGPLNLTRTFELDEFPVFIKGNSIVPIDRSYQKLPYMQLQPTELKPSKELLLVHLVPGVKDEVIHRSDHTDYLRVEVAEQGETNIQIERFYKEKVESQKKQTVRITLVGVLVQEKDSQIYVQKISSTEYNQQNLTQNEQRVQAFHDQEMGTVSFDIEIGSIFTASNVNWE